MSWVWFFIGERNSRARVYACGGRRYDAIVCTSRKERSLVSAATPKAMSVSAGAPSAYGTAVIKALTCAMFFTFAMTTDAVGSVIPTLLEEFRLSLKAASAFHYVPMIAIAGGSSGTKETGIGNHESL